MNKDVLVSMLMLMLCPLTYAAENDLNSVDETALENLKTRYWSQGEEGEIGVVQNRTYSKVGKFEFGIMGGVQMNDPFISTQSLGVDLGFHLSEFIAIRLLALKYFSKGSAALSTFEKELEATTNTNFLKNYYGAEVAGSLFYGKLSVLGAMIIYYDLYLTAGGGITVTENGNLFTPSLGIGQRFYLNQYLSLKFDYKFSYYKETIVEKQIVTKLGEVVGNRNVLNHSMLLGLEFLIPVEVLK